jgi:mannitol/fructose-specific phosphotransferase system IIA component (Ntr-type)
MRDRFDGVVEACPIRDIEGPRKFEDLKKEVSLALSESMGTSASAVLDRLSQVGRESAVVIAGGVAIPHIIVEGERKFAAVVLRSLAGIYFSEAAPDVRTVFVLASSEDERNFHLRALAAIAEIVQQPGFHDKWMQARNADELRSLLLLSKRRRDVKGLS